MDSQFEIREILSSEANRYKEFLLVGLIQDEESFRISPGDEKQSEFPTKGTEDSFTLLGAVDGQWAGVVSFEREGKNREKLRHKGLCFRMYVSSQFRGRGVARKLLVALIERVKKIKDIDQINLTVVANNDGARKLYASLGFVSYGLETNAIKWKGKSFDEEFMSLVLV